MDHQHRGLVMFVAIAAVAIAVVGADGEGVQALQGEELPMGWVKSRHDIGEGGAPLTVLTTSATYSETNEGASYTYKVVSGGKPVDALKELEGEELMGESVDSSEEQARVTVSGLQAMLEKEADMMGKVSRLNAVKVLLSMPAAKSERRMLDAESLVQVSASAGWGRRRRGSQWQQNPVAQQKKAEEKADADKADGKPPAPPGPKPPPKVIVKQTPEEEVDNNANANPMDEAKVKADKAIEMAREKGDKATQKAEEEAKAAEQEANDKKAFELAEKRKHEVTNKEEKQREKRMKEETERTQKKAKEAAVKAEQLSKAVEKAKEAADKEQKVEKEKKKAKEAKQKEERKVMIEKAKEKAAKDTKEAADKKIAEIQAKFGGESSEKSQKEKTLKHKHEQAQKKVDEVSKKKTEELARKTADEAKQKDEEEKALKAKDEKKMKAALEAKKKAEEERSDKAEKEGSEKKKRELALKAAAKRRIEEEQEAKNEKRKAMEVSAEMATKKSEEQHKKAEEEGKQKLKEEVELKKDREKKEKDAREVTTKKAEEIVRKTTREHADKLEQEKSGKAFTETQHKEKKKKGFEKVQKILEGLKDYEEQLAKAKKALEEKKKVYNAIEPTEAKHKAEAGNLSKIAKELAQKIKGTDEKKDEDVCDLGNNLESIKKKGLLKGSEGECSITCALKPNDLGIEVHCNLDGKENPDCKKPLYTRMQSLSSAVISEFDAFKKCTLAKAASNASGPAGSAPKNLDTPGENPAAEYMLGEAPEAHMAKKADDAVGVGDYIYALKDLQDVTGTVGVAHAMDLLMKCDRDTPAGAGKKHINKSDDDDDEFGESYDPSQSEQFSVASKSSEAAADGNGPDCDISAVKSSIENILVSSADGCQCHCGTEEVDFAAFSSECTGGGKMDCFLQSTETYYRSVAGAFLSWKRQCAGVHGDNMLTQLEA